MKRRDFCLTAAAASVLPMLGSPALAKLNAEGIHTQPWFMETFMDLREDHGELAAKNKHFAIFFEQKGCPYCAAMHEKNLSQPAISNFIQEKFGVLQINIFGSKEITDFDGKTMEERQLARRWGVMFTPTIVFIRPKLDVLDGLNGKQLQIARMPGYFKRFHFMTFFEYIAGDHYETIDFQRFLQAKADKMRKEGKEVEIWG